MQNYFLIGSPIQHSLSPKMMNLSFRLLDIDAEYRLCESTLENTAETVKFLKSKNAAGWNITMPCKNAMHALCDELSPAAQIGGAVNTVENRGGRLIGHTTDGVGFVSAVTEAGVPVKDQKITLFGTGGAASSILIQTFLDGAGEIAVYCNRPESAAHITQLSEVLAAHSDSKTRIKIRSYRDKEILRKDLAESALLVNGTNIGMSGSPHAGESLVPDPSYLHSSLYVYDVIYHPTKTPLLAMAEQAGCRFDHGLSMLIGQGAAAFEIWTGRKMPIHEVTEALSAAILS